MQLPFPGVFFATAVENPKGFKLFLILKYPYAQVRNVRFTFMVPETAARMTQDVEDQGVAVYPNPTTGHVRVDVPLSSAGPVTLRVLSLSGRELQTQTRYLSKGTQTLAADLSPLPSGLYVLEIQTSVNTQRVKLRRQ